MKAKKELKRPIASFIILTNLIFLPLFLLVVVTKILGLPTVVLCCFMYIILVINICIYDTI